MKCPKCESENTQRLEVAYQNGTQNISTTSNSAGLGFSGGRIGIAGGVTRATSQTQSVLATSCAPPAQKPNKNIKLLVGASAISTMTLFQMHWLLGLLGLALTAFTWRRLREFAKFNSTEWPQLYQHWSESWICHKCGSIYHQP